MEKTTGGKEHRYILTDAATKLNHARYSNNELHSLNISEFRYGKMEVKCKVTISR
jgi:hypothetical protein